MMKDFKRKLPEILMLLMDALRLTQKELAEQLGISGGMLSNYLKGRRMPSADVLIRIARMAGKPLEDLLSEEKPSINVGGTKIIAIGSKYVAGGDIYFDRKKRKVVTYEHGPDDITPKQANTIKRLVDEIVEMEKKTKTRPKSHAAVYSALKRKFGVTYYREIPAERFGEAEMYLQRWIGRIKRELRTTDKEGWRKRTYGAIHARAREIGYSREAVKDIIFERYRKASIKDLTDQELDSLYSAFFSGKR